MPPHKSTSAVAQPNDFLSWRLYRLFSVVFIKCLNQPQLYGFFCFQTVFLLTVHSLMEREVRWQVKPTPACLPAVILPKSGKGPQDQQSLAPSDFYRCQLLKLMLIFGC